MPGPDFVRSVMQRLGASSPADLATKMGWKRGTERLVAKWLNGDNRPGYERTWEMLDRAGWLNLEAKPSGLPQDLQPSTAELAARMDDALENQNRMWEQLEQLVNAGADLVASLDLLRQQVVELRTQIESPSNGRRRAGRGG